VNKTKPLLNILVVVGALLTSFHFLQAQSKVTTSVGGKKRTIELLHANSGEHDDKLGGGAQRLIGNAAFKDGNTIMYCDSAYLYENNSADAFGHIHITQGDSINAYGEFLKYNGDTKIGQLDKNVSLTDKDMILTTNTLFFNTKNNVATYHDGGTIVNKENTLTSQHGYYFSNTKELAFKKNVVLTNPRYTMMGDTLNYNTASKITRFLGPTRIKSKDDFIYCENGFYNTVTDIAQFDKNAYIISKNQKLKADSMFYDKKNGIGKGFQNISITDTTQNIIINGDYGYSNELTNTAIVTGNAVMSQIYEKDTLFVHADTLKAAYEKKSIADNQYAAGSNVQSAVNKQQLTSNNQDSTYRILLAYHKVKFFKSDIQGKCDSMAYTYRDSIMRLFKEPILWSQKNQLTAENIELKTSKGALQSMLMTNSAFIISQEDSLKFNQIKGKIMHGFFADNKLYKIHVEGNGQTVYYGKDKNKYIGVNKADCSDLLIFMKNNEVQKITFITKPDATLFPINELSPKELLLKNFLWKIDLRPKSKKDIFVWEEEPKALSNENKQ